MTKASSSRSPRKSTRRPASRDPAKSDFSFTPVAVRARHDGWTPERQVAFIEALAECGCVTDAAKRVGKSTETAYALRARFDAQPFRMAWDAALDYAIRRLSDSAYSRALHGVVVPHYYKGELIGEHRRYDGALTRFLLRYRDPQRYGRIRDKIDPGRHEEYAATRLALSIDDIERGESSLEREVLEATGEPLFVDGRSTDEANQDRAADPAGNTHAP